MEGTNTDGNSCTLNGFLASRNGKVVPEFYCIEVKPMEKVKLHRVVNSKDTVVGIFEGLYFRAVN